MHKQHRQLPEKRKRSHGQGARTGPHLGSAHSAGQAAGPPADSQARQGQSQSHAGNQDQAGVLQRPGPQVDVQVPVVVQHEPAARHPRCRSKQQVVPQRPRFLHTTRARLKACPTVACCVPSTTSTLRGHVEHSTDTHSMVATIRLLKVACKQR